MYVDPGAERIFLLYARATATCTAAKAGFISMYCWYFLHKSGSEMTCIVNGDRRRSEVDGRKGLVVPCVYIFKGKQKHLERLINLFAKLQAKLGTSNRLF